MSDRFSAYLTDILDLSDKQSDAVSFVFFFILSNCQLWPMDMPMKMGWKYISIDWQKNNEVLFLICFWTVFLRNEVKLIFIYFPVSSQQNSVSSFIIIFFTVIKIILFIISITYQRQILKNKTAWHALFFHVRTGLEKNLNFSSISRICIICHENDAI